MDFENKMELKMLCFYLKYVSMKNVVKRLRVRKRNCHKTKIRMFVTLLPDCPTEQKSEAKTRMCQFT